MARAPLDATAMAEHAAHAAALLKSLAHPARLQVLCRLVEGEAPVPELQALTGLSASALSQHLAVLREDGLVLTRRDGQSVYYSLPKGSARRIVETLHGLYCGTGKA